MIRIRKRFLMWAAIFLLGSLCTCPTMFVAPIFMPEVVGDLTVGLTKYPEAQLLYNGSRVVGSSEWQSRKFVLWTRASLASVQSHYEKYFPQFTPRIYSAGYDDFPSSIYSDSYVLFIGFQVRLMEADQDNKSSGMLDSWSGDLYGAIDNAPYTGTLIIIDHDIFAG